MRLRTLAAVLATVCSSAVAVPSVEAQEATDSARVAELERRLEAISREIERLQLGRTVIEADSSILGFGPAASKVYRVNQGVSIGGYGEVVYENFAREREDGTPASASDRMDALRAILYVGYKFSDRLLFNSEIEVEHADEIFLEFAYLDYLLSDGLGVRGGLLLAPMGFVNELHEPPVYLGTERSVTESRIIPTTWRENGIGLFGGDERFAWRAYVLNSLDAAGFSGAGLRGGRQKGSKALAEDLGLVGRLDWLGTPGLTLGASAYLGGTGQGREVDGRTVEGRLLLWDLHADYQRHGLQLRGLVARASLDGADDVNALNDLEGAAGVGEALLGWYVEAGYDVLRGTDSTHRLIPYLRYEAVDTQHEVASGFAADPANDLTVWSLGAAWKPVPQVVAKLGYQIHSNAANTGVDQWNVQLGWLF